MVKNLPANEGDIREVGWIPPGSGRQIPLEESVATHSTILPWRTPWTEEPVGLQTAGLLRVGHY